LERHPSGAKIKEAREPTGLSAYDFSKIARIPVSRYQAIESGKVVATPEEAWQIAEALAPNPADADPIVFYDAPDDTGKYRGNRGRVAGPVTQAQQQQMFARDEERRRQTGLRQWLRSASAEEVKQQKELVSELRALDMKLDGQSSIADS
jgi:transcriptional regulator with XRE-family HTH domain